MSAALATSTPVSPLPAYRQPKRRGSELLLLVLGFGIGTLAYVQVDYAVLGHLDDNTLSVLGVVALLLLIAHSAIRWLAAYADPIMFPLAAALNILGLTMIHRLDLAAAVSAGRNGTAAPRPEAYAQLTWTALGLGLMVIVLLIVRDHRKLQRYTYTSLLGALVLLVLPLAPIVGKSIGGATIWVRVAGYSFQPGELSKILLTIFFAGYLVVKRDSLALVRTRVLGMGFPRGRDLGPIVAAWLFSLGILVFENDFGMSLLFFGLSVLLLYIATQRRSWLAMGFVLFVGGAVVAYLLVSHVRVRFDIWLHPFDYASTTGYQLVQSLYGLASGGIFGSGLGQGYPQLVPFAKSDFIFAAFGEEIGLAGLLALLVIYAIIVERGLRTAVACRDPFGTLLAAGLAIVFGLQTFIVVGGVTRLIPLTGLTTPFLSQGGSSLIANWIAIGLLLRISNSTRRPDPSYKSDDAETQVVRL